MAKETISTDELILKLVETADEYGVVDKPYSGVYGRILKERVRYKADPMSFIVSRAKELTGKDINIYTQKNQLDLYRLQLEQMGLVQDVKGVATVDARVLLGEKKLVGEKELDIFKARKLYDKIKEYSKSRKVSIDEVFAMMGLKYIRMRGPSISTMSEADIIAMIASYDKDHNGNVDDLRKDKKAIHKIRDWIRADEYEATNDDVFAILSDFMIQKCPQYYFSTTLVKTGDTIHTIIYHKLKQIYGNKASRDPKEPILITNLKQDHKYIYQTLTRIKREMPEANAISMKEFIETMYPEFQYETDVLVSLSKMNEKAIVAELRAIYGAPNLSVPVDQRPMVSELSKDCRIYSNVYRLACNHMMTVKEYLESLGYQYSDLRQKFDTMKNKLRYMDTIELYDMLGLEVSDGMRSHFREREKNGKSKSMGEGM